MRGDREAAGRLKGPAISLVVVASLCLLALMAGLAIDVALLAGGGAAQLEADRPGVGNAAGRRAIDPVAAVQIRMAWSGLMVLANGLILAGAAAMLRVRTRGLATAACVLAVIPCLGPCFVLGIPFGIWGLAVMNDPAVRRAFDADD